MRSLPPSLETCGEETHSSHVHTGHIPPPYSMEDLQQHFNVGLKEAAAKLGICPTTLKRACRRCVCVQWLLYSFPLSLHNNELPRLSPRVTPQALHVNNSHTHIHTHRFGIQRWPRRAIAKLQRQMSNHQLSKKGGAGAGNGAHDTMNVEDDDDMEGSECTCTYTCHLPLSLVQR